MNRISEAARASSSIFHLRFQAMLRLEVRLGWRASRNLDLEIRPFHVSRVAAHACVHVTRRRHHSANDQAVHVASATSIRHA